MQCCPPTVRRQSVVVLPPPPAAAELPSPPPAAVLPTPPAAGAPLQYWHQCPHHHFACCHPGRCHHHPHGSRGLNQAAEVRDEAWGEEEDKPGEPYSTSKTHIPIISIIKFFNLPPFENLNEFVTTFKDALLRQGKKLMKQVNKNIL